MLEALCVPEHSDRETEYPIATSVQLNLLSVILFLVPYKSCPEVIFQNALCNQNSEPLFPCSDPRVVVYFFNLPAYIIVYEKEKRKKVCIS